ncbi:hypothetical protein [Xanthomonas fragariae]|uniref:hypothetical protein n=1 Tax=Xanthomonas fragariae TaxID=48664 RepID=UPI003D18BEA3
MLLQPSRRIQVTQNGSTQLFIRLADASGGMRQFAAVDGMCGTSREQALTMLTALKRATGP